MKILFITQAEVKSIEDKNIYADLMRYFRDLGHEITIISPFERRTKQKTQIFKSDSCVILRVRTLNLQKTNLLEKTISHLTLSFYLTRAIKKYLDINDVDLLLYTTPPITFLKTIEFIKNISGAKTYLLLKDIFPQNAIDIGLTSKYSPIYKYFRNIEKKFYAISDKIGCMSPSNVSYILKHNKFLQVDKVEVCPNAIYWDNVQFKIEKKADLRKRFNLPKNCKIFVYGGNLGLPQGVPFIIQFLELQKNKLDNYFLIIGSGTEYPKLLKWFKVNKPDNMRLIQQLPKDEYDLLVKACDVGLIFLDYRFTIPNFPSRLLTYLEYGLPIISATDPNTDIGTIAEENNFGRKAYSNNPEKLSIVIDEFTAMSNSEIEKMGSRGRNYLLKEYLVQNCYEKIMTFYNTSNQKEKMTTNNVKNLTVFN